MRDKMEIKYQAGLYLVGLDREDNLAINYFKQAYSEILLLNILSKLPKEELSLTDFYNNNFTDTGVLYSDYERMTEHYRNLTADNILHSKSRGNKSFEKVFISNKEQAMSLLAIKLIDPKLSLSEVDDEYLSACNKILKKMNTENPKLAEVKMNNKPKLLFNTKIKYEEYLKIHKYFNQEILKYSKDNQLYSLYTLEKSMNFLYFQRMLKCIYLYGNKLRNGRVVAKEKNIKLENLANNLISLYLTIDLTLLRSYVLQGLEIVIVDTQFDVLAGAIDSYLSRILKANSALESMGEEICKVMTYKEIQKGFEYTELGRLQNYLYPFYLIKGEDYTIGTENLLKKVLFQIKNDVENGEFGT
ncbi:hypothetical protein CW663_09525 [Macrococcoides caseolyticum]|nr:hypothetical protein CW663_09525 [Macrococcus caseolyticus]